MKKNKNVALELKSFIKFLELLIDENLSWKNHVHTLTTFLQHSKTFHLFGTKETGIGSNLVRQLACMQALPLSTL